MGFVHEYLRQPNTATDDELVDYLMELALRPRNVVSSDLLSGMTDFVLHLQRCGYSMADIRLRAEWHLQRAKV